MRASSVVRLRSLATVAMFLATPLAAQVGRVVGSVVDAESGQPVDNVQVFLRGTGRGASTQANGRYFILNVQPGQYTVSARRLGYQEQQITNVTVLIDVSREINFRLSKTSATLAAVRIEAPPTPLIQPGITGSSDAITAADLQALPVVDVKGALALQAGFLAVPENTDVLSYTDRTRGLEPVRVRGGRPGETLTLIDGIPVNNFLFGGPAIDISTAAVQQIDYVRGGFEPQYGNALSGIINIAVREGTSDLQGTVEVQSSGAGGAIGSRYDELRDYNLVQGFVSGSVPAMGNKLRYMVAGKQRSGASRVLEFDDEVYNPRADERDPNNNFNSVYDLFPGFRAIGFDNQRDVTAKASYYFTPLRKLNFTIIDYAKQTQPYSFDWVQTGFDGFAQCSKLYPDLVEQCSSIYNDGKTVTSIDDLQDTNNENWYVRQASSHQTRRLYAAQLSQTLGRLAVTTSVGEFRQERSTCVYLSGVCIPPPLVSSPS